MLKHFALYFCFSFLGFSLHAQDVIEILKLNPGSYKKYELHVNDVIEYKLKGEHRYKTDIIRNMGDGKIFLEKDSLIELDQIKSFRFHRSSHLLGTLNSVCFIGGIGYVSLNVINNVILEGTLKADPRALYISGALIVVGVILKLVRIKHVRIRSNTSVKMVKRDFQNLGE